MKTEQPASLSSKPLKIDVHIHLAGTGCCDSGVRLSAGFRKRYTFQLLKIIHGITNKQMDTTIDQDWAERIHRYVQDSQLDYGVVLGFDGAYDHHSGHEVTDELQMHIPSSWVFAVCRKYQGLLPGPSINPFRADALDELDYCIDQGACLIKWLPSAQNINPSDRKISRFYEKLAQADVPLLMHMGGEKTFRTLNESYSRVEHMEPALDHGVKVICAHTATRILGSSEVDQLSQLKILLARYDRLYVDNSGLCNPSRFAHVPSLARDQEITSRTLYGSDWPVPSNAFYYLNRLGWKKIMQLERLKNPLDRDISIKSALGYPESTMYRAGDVLAHLDQWTKSVS